MTEPPSAGNITADNSAVAVNRSTAANTVVFRSDEDARLFFDFENRLERKISGFHKRLTAIAATAISITIPILTSISESRVSKACLKIALVCLCAGLFVSVVRSHFRIRAAKLMKPILAEQINTQKFAPIRIQRNRFEEYIAEPLAYSCYALALVFFAVAVAFC
jgi:sensor c-di-GMP phosphodiesterase-like protein